MPSDFQPGELKKDGSYQYIVFI